MSHSFEDLVMFLLVVICFLIWPRSAKAQQASQEGGVYGEQG